jgi:hypothetical protein
MPLLRNSWLVALTLAMAGPALAQDAPPAQDITPGAKREGVVHVNAVRNPEMHAYRAIVAGLDMFDDQHALAPNVPKLQFQVSSRGGKSLQGPLPTAKLTADDFDLPLPIDPASALFTVPRNRQAWDSKAELRLSRKRKEVKVMPWVRSPGLADNQRRLGDLRLECKVTIAIVKEEIPFWVNALVDSLLLTRDWCSFFKDGDRGWSVHVPAELSGAWIQDGDRSAKLAVHDRQFEIALADPLWSNDAVVTLEFAPAGAGKEE